MPIAGENLVPLGFAATGAAYRLGQRGPDTLSVLVSGQRQREYAAARDRKAKADADAKAGKELLDNLKYDVDGSHYFGQTLREKVYNKLNDDLASTYKEYPNDSLSRAIKTAPILQSAQSETKQSAAKTKYLDDTIRQFGTDTKLYRPEYATTNLITALRGEDGTARLPSQFDEEAWAAAVRNDPSLYNEPEVVKRATQGLFPVISQRVADAGGLGGQHTAEQVRGRLVAMQNGRPVLNADGTPKLNLSADTQELLDHDKLFKLQIDAREAAYNAKREADPSLPRMSRRGHMAQALSALAFYDQQHDESLNPLPPRPRAASPKQIIATPTVTASTSYYRPTDGGPTAPNHYAGVGHSFGSATHPYVDVNVNSSALEIQGKDGQPTKLNFGNNSQVPIRLTGRDYVLYANGKRLGRTEPYTNEAEAYKAAQQLVADSPHPEKIELRVMGRGVVVDKARVAGDGLGGGAVTPLIDPTTNKPIPGPTETEHTVTFPMTQEVDATLERVTNRAWNHYKASDQEKALIQAVRKRGGRLVTPYSTVRDTPPAPAAKAIKPSAAARPSFLSTKTTAPKAPTQAPNKSADKSGGML